MTQFTDKQHYVCTHTLCSHHHHVQKQWQFRMLSFVHDKNTTRCIIFNTHYGTQLHFYKCYIVHISCGYMVDDPGENFSAYYTVKEKQKRHQSRLPVSAWHYATKLAVKTIYIKMHGQLITMVKLSQSQFITTPLYMMVNSSHDFRRF